VSVDKAAYYIALEGATRHSLSEAVKAILRGALGHTFFPSPVEIRQQCDAVMSWHVQERRRIDNTRRQLQERRRFDEVDAQRTPQARARVEAAYASFCAGYEAQKPIEPGVYLDPELVAQVPDAPTPFKRAKL
jgi:hypothetical protein